MPNKTIYVKDADLALFDRAQEDLGESVSSLFAEFLRERVKGLTPEEKKIVEFINEVVTTRRELKKDRFVPEFVDGAYGEAADYAGKSLASLRAGEIRKAKIFWYAANTYREWADQGARETRELGGKIAEMLGTGAKRPARRRKPGQ